MCGTYAPERDGVADHVRLLAAHLAPAGVEPLVAAAGAGAPYSLASRWDAAGVAAAGRALAALEPDVVHVHWAPSAYGFRGAVGLLPLALPRGLPVVTTMHEYGGWARPARLPAGLWPRVERHGWDRETLLLGPRSAAVVVTNEGHARTVRERLGREPTLLPLGPNVEPVAATGAAARAEFGLPVGVPVVTFFGFVHPVKGIRYLLDAVARLRAGGHPELRLLVVGAVQSLALRGTEAAAFEAELRAQIAGLGLQGAVTLTGWVPSRQVSMALRAADVGALPFTHGVTAKSGSLLAAYSHGLPLVVTEGGDDAVVGVRCTPRDALSLAAGLDRLLRSAALRAELADGGLERARERSWPRIAAAHRRVYDAARRAVAAGG